MKELGIVRWSRFKSSNARTAPTADAIETNSHCCWASRGPFPSPPLLQHQSSAAQVPSLALRVGPLCEVISLVGVYVIRKKECGGKR